MIVAGENIEIKYGKDVIIKDGNFKVNRGDFVCIVGANGSGKSTLVEAILGLTALNSGQIMYGAGIDERSIGYLPQEFRMEYDFPATVSEVVMSGALGRKGHMPFYNSGDRRRTRDALKKLNVFELRKKRFSELSGGQKQKVLLARALVATSELLILDEPSNNLDQVSRKEFYSILKKINQEMNLTILMITHDLDADDLIGNKVFTINDQSISCRTTEDFLGEYK